MSKSKLFEDWYEKVSGDDVVVDADAIMVEALENMWTFPVHTLPEEKTVDADELSIFIVDMSLIRSQWLRSRNAEAMIFYAWYDDQLRAVRFSTVSKSHGKLPFGRPLDIVNHASAVASIACGGERSFGKCEPELPAHKVMKVWACEI
ncbi:hypothetical protein [Luteibacter yeojuensis]